MSRKPPFSKRAVSVEPVSRRWSLVSVAAVAIALTVPCTASAATYPQGFSETTVFSGLTNPTAIRFASDGRVFVAEKMAWSRSSTR